MNFICILLDDLGWNDVGVHNKNILTPNINALTNEACELKRNYSFSVCSPTRAMINTGIYAFKYGYQTLIPAWGYYGLNEKLKIIPQYFKEIGYETFAIGKWHLGHNNKKWLPHNRGYNYHYGCLTGCIDNISHKEIPNNIYDWSENGKPKYDTGYTCDLITKKTIDVIEKNKDNKFFIYLAYTSPHLPHQSPENFNKIYNHVDEPKKSYYSMISHLDYNLGLIFKKLKDLNIYEETLIWIQSDNGGWTPNWAKGDNYPLRDGKCSFYDGGVKVFSLIKYKDLKIKYFEGFSHSVDILPTFLDFAGYDKPLENIDGISIKNDLLNDTKTKRDIVLNFYNKDMWCFIIDGIKFINQKGVIECYDLINDPIEKNNIVANTYENFKSKIDLLIKECNEKFIDSPNPWPSICNLKELSNTVKYWGQPVKKLIKVQNEVANDCKKEDTFLQLSGYDIFYDK